MLWICYASPDFWLYLLLLLVYGTVVPTNFTRIKLDQKQLEEYLTLKESFHYGEH